MSAEMKSSESKPDAKAVLDIADRLDALYVSNRTRYVRMKKDGSFFVPKCGDHAEPLSLDILRGHVLREYTVCVFASEHGSRFLCFDVDDGSKDTVYQVMNCLISIGFSTEELYVSQSGGKGYHIEVFFEKPLELPLLRALYMTVIQRCGLTTRQVELRPTVGLAIKLPLSVHWKTGRVCWFVDRST